MRIGTDVYVHRAKTCAGCAWEGVLYRLTPSSGTWERLPDAPGLPSPDRAQVLEAFDEVVVVSDAGDRGITAVAFDPDEGTWRDLQAPATGPLEWRAVATGVGFVVVATSQAPDGTEVSGALHHNLPQSSWQDISDGLPLLRAHAAAPVWTGHELVLYGSPTAEGAAPAGATYAFGEGWAPLPGLAWDDPALQGRSLPDGPPEGLVGVWDGDPAHFAGGLDGTVFVSWSPEEARWRVQDPPPARTGGTAVWTGAHVLLWGGVDRRGPVLDLQAWPGQPGSPRFRSVVR